jgi:hypothetical protein
MFGAVLRLEAADYGRVTEMEFLRSEPRKRSSPW